MVKTPDFGWRVGVSILVVFGWLIFLILWLLFSAKNYDAYQNLAAILVSTLAGIAILAASWASWGIKYGLKYRNEWNNKEHVRGHGLGSAVYGLGFIGALVYYVTAAPNVWVAILGIFKAIVWPAFLVYGALKFLGM
jgi:hypothetical protein